MLDETERLQGIFTERDVIDKVTLPQLGLDSAISTVMRTPVFSLSEDDAAQQAAAFARQFRGFFAPRPDL